MYHDSPIAIIGMGCRFPGARDPDEFWRLLVEGREAISEVPKDRWDIDDYYDPDPLAPGKMNTRWGGFIERVEHFDPQFFGISPREAACMDPQQRLLLEVAWEALEDAGQVPERLAGTPVGVFMGVSSYDYGRADTNPTAIEAYMGTGNAGSIAANRLSYLFDFRGPSLVVDTACSSALVAVHLACQSLWKGESSLAIVGGANIILSPTITITFTKAGMMSPDGRCKAFDAAANGYVRGEGVGGVILKPLAEALEDGDAVYAVIRGTAVNQDGRSNGITAPSREAQEDVIREACRQAGILPGQLDYVETHGTGTPLGDPIEAKALGSVVREGRAAGGRCAIGSVKTNIGHLEAAAGIASLMKTALALKHRQVPASLHFRTANPLIPFENLPLRVQQSAGPWPTGAGPALAGVNSFGFGGTNAHVILEEAPRHSTLLRSLPEAPRERPFLLTLSAQTGEALNSTAACYRDFLLRNSVGDNLPDICLTAGSRRTHHDHRLVVVGRSPGQLAANLDAFLKQKPCAGIYSGRRKADHRSRLAFVFPGQGHQWYAMGRQLLDREPVFRDALQECDSLFQSWAAWSLLREMSAGESQSRLEQTEFGQPAIFAFQVALAALWRSWGVEPEAVVGHSMGEVAAAHFAGMLSLPDAARIIFHRARLMQRAAGMGRMAALRTSQQEAFRIIEGYEDRLSIAACNSPGITVVSGDTAALAAVLETHTLEVAYQYLPVNYAFHSPQMAGFQGEIMDALRGLEPSTGSTPMISTVTGQPVSGPELDSAYWWNNVRQKVLFSTAIETVLAQGCNTFLEISAHPALLSAVSECATDSRAGALLLPSLRRNTDDQEQMLGSLASLHIGGHPVDWRSLYPQGTHATLPANAWQSQPFWHPGIARGGARAVRQEPTGHPLLGRRLDSATPIWESDLGVLRLPYLASHRVDGKIVYPAAAYLETALAAFFEVSEHSRCVLSDVRFERPLTLPESGTRRVEMVLTQDSNGPESFRLYSQTDSDTKAWTLHASGSFEAVGDEPGPVEPEFPAAILKRCPDELPAVECYRLFLKMGLDYGPAFRGIDRVWRGDGEALALIRIPEVIQGETGKYRIHPALLDACGQTLVAMADDGRAFIPGSIDHVRFYAASMPRNELWVHARLTDPGDSPGPFVRGDGRLFDADGNLIAEVEGLQLECLEAPPRSRREDIDDWFYQIEWRTAPLVPGPSVASSQGNWLIFADPGGLWKPLAAFLTDHGDRYATIFPGPAGVFMEEYLSGELERELRLSGQPCKAIVHMWSLAASGEPGLSLLSLQAAQRRDSGSILELVQHLVLSRAGLAPRLWVVTRGVQQPSAASPPDLAAAPLWGLGRVLANEHPELHCTNVDLSGPSDIDALAQELWAGDAETQVLLREGRRYVARLSRLALPDGRAMPRPGRLEVPAGLPFRLGVSSVGSLDNLEVREVSRPPLAAGQIEIEVSAAGLNFRDVMKALGIYPSAPGDEFWLGDECSGAVVAVGAGVDAFRSGDQVLAIAPASFGKYVRVPAGFAARVPTGLSLEQAAALPIAFTTAFYALHHLARLESGESILIHAAAGGVGLAAVQCARHMGAKVFATAGNPEKREYLHSLGVEHVFDSRSLAFADEIVAVTGRKGVDVVLNSLAGAAIPKSLSALAPYGRFLEIGKRDIFQNRKIGLSPFRNNLSFFAIDMEKVFRDRPLFAAGLLADVVALFRSGALRPLPCRVFPLSESESAFRHLAQARNIGKVVISISAATARASQTSAPALLRPDRTYLIAGGLGGLGLELARRMVQRGARNLALLGRHAPTTAAEELLASGIRPHARVECVQADISDPGQCAAALGRIRESLPPLAGVFHAAGVLDDARLLHMNYKRFSAVTSPKLSGAWNLHRETLDTPLDFFVLFSSIASVFGSPGQANYAAGNSFLDALAQYRRSLGMPALSINWGPWSEVGMAAGMSDRALLEVGMVRISPAQALDALERLMRLDLAQVVAAGMDWQQWSRQQIFDAANPLFADFRRHASPRQDAAVAISAVRQSILAADPGARQAILESYMVAELARVLQMDPARLDIHEPLDSLGLDSLMAIEYKHRLDTELGVDLSIMSLLDGPTMSQIAAQFLEAIGLTGDSPVGENSDSLAFGSPAA